MPQPLNSSSLFLPLFNMLVTLPSPSSLTFMWNLGSMAGICLMVQVLTGFMLTLHYHSSTMDVFLSIYNMCTEVNYGWALRTLHANGASVFFIILYLHMARGFYFQSYSMPLIWIIGIILLFLAMASAFLGYVLPWGQMSYWGATVITNLVSVIPVVGHTVVESLWGGYSVSSDTLLRFYSLHFMLPLLMIAIVLIHLHVLHMSGSSSSNFMSPNYDKVSFHPLFTFKDLLGFMLVLVCLVGMTLVWPYTLSDPDNFIEANPLVTPVHIKPEWYFLFAYAILRCIPNKLGGVLALLLSILIFGFITMLPANSAPLSTTAKATFWILVSVLSLLTWLGGMSVEPPFIFITQALSIMYVTSIVGFTAL